MALADLPEFIVRNYDIYEWRHSTAIFVKDFPEEWNDLIEVLSNFRLKKSWV